MNHTQSVSSPAALLLPFGLTFEDLYRREGLELLDAEFLGHLRAADEALHGQLLTARRDPLAFDHKTQSEIIIAIAPHLEDFIGELFGIQAEVRQLQERHHELAPIFAVKR